MNAYSSVRLVKNNFTRLVKDNSARLSKGYRDHFRRKEDVFYKQFERKKFSRTSFKATDAISQHHTQLSNKSDRGRVRKIKERNIHRLDKVESVNPYPKFLAKIYTKRNDYKRYTFLESLECLPDS